MTYSGTVITFVFPTAVLAVVLFSFFKYLHSPLNAQALHLDERH